MTSEKQNKFQNLKSRQATGSGGQAPYWTHSRETITCQSSTSPEGECCSWGIVTNCYLLPRQLITTSS